MVTLKHGALHRCYTGSCLHSVSVHGCNANIVLGMQLIHCTDDTKWIAYLFRMTICFF